VTDRDLETAALVAVLVGGAPTRSERAMLIEPHGATTVLESRHGMLAEAELERARRLIRSWSERGIGILATSEEGYPLNLRPLPDRPPALFVRGRLLLADAHSVAVVGTRRPSALGLTAARDAVSRLVDAGYTIVSGLAAGIDTAAHAAALRGGGRTVAVLGTGVDRYYPSANRVLQERIASRCAVVSCFQPGSPPTRHSFPIRNRVMSGLALATVIVEASATSGTRIQARTSIEQGRPVVLLEDVLREEWASQLAMRGSAHVVARPADLPDAIGALLNAGSGRPAASLVPTPEPV
jgi:DNA processing protein